MRNVPLLLHAALFFGPTRDAPTPHRTCSRGALHHAAGPSRRRLVQAFCELTNREMEYVAVSRDTTEGDLKQRRELSAGNSLFFDSAPVRAAVHGRLLVLDGIEKAERNVLPTLNNLLETREMALEDGRFLLRHTTYDSIAAAHDPPQNLVRNVPLLLHAALFFGPTRVAPTHTVPAHGARCIITPQVRVDPSFRVVALGLPVPPFPGHTLDPPLRSRFQARVVTAPGAGAVMDTIASFAPSLDAGTQRGLAAVAETLRVMEGQQRSAGRGGEAASRRFPTFPHYALSGIAAQLESLSSSDPATVLARAYPALTPVLRGPQDQALVETAQSVVSDRHAPSKLNARQ